MTTLLPPGKQQFSDANGVPLAGGSVFFYIPGTTTFKNTWQDASQVTLNTNPVILDAAGEAVIYGLGAYRQLVQDSLGNLIWDQLTSSTDQGGIYSGGVSTGTAANQILAVTVPAGFSLTAGNQLTFIAGFTTTGATTLNANGTGAKNILKPGTSGPVPLAAGDFVVGNAVELFYDGTQYQMMSSVPAALPSKTINAQTGTTYPIVSGDRAKLITRTNAATMADTLPIASAVGAGWYASITVLAGSVGDLTITPTTSTIDGLAAISLAPGQSAVIVSDGTNYVTERGRGRVLPPVMFETGAVATGSTQIPNDDTIPQNTEGDQYLSVAITPVSATSTLYIDVQFEVASNATGVLTAALFQDSTANALAAMQQDYVTSGAQANFAFRHKMTSGTIVSTTFKVRAGNVAAGTTTFNGVGGARFMGGVMASSITVTEVLP